MNKKLNYDILANFRDKNEIIGYLKSNEFDYGEKILQFLMEYFKNENDESNYLTLKQLELVAAGIKGIECELIPRSNNFSFSPFDSFAQRIAIRRQLLQFKKNGESVVEHFNGIEKLDKENCTFETNGEKYICFPNGNIVQILKEEIPIFNKKVSMGVDPQVAAAYIFNGTIPGIPKVVSQYASITSSRIELKDSVLIVIAHIENRTYGQGDPLINVF